MRGAPYTAYMTPEFQPLNLNLLYNQRVPSQALLTAAREHVGAAGLEQMRALEHLIAVGQEHGGLVEAVRRLLVVLRHNETSTMKQLLVRDTEHLLVLLDQLAAVVEVALQQITATPVQSISAERLQKITTQMQGHFADLELLVQAAEQHPDIPESSTPDLEAIMADLRDQLRDIEANRRRAHLDVLVQLASQATRDLAELTELSAADRTAAVEAIQTVGRRCLETLSTVSRK